ncbi:ISKra4 family transposase [Pseudactinotalea sp. HY158]|nr:ISKra4 family transposase [Pseudactinotalea sp. HY158]
MCDGQGLLDDGGGRARGAAFAGAGPYGRGSAVPAWVVAGGLSQVRAGDVSVCSSRRAGSWPAGVVDSDGQGAGWLARAVHPGRSGRPGPRRAGQLRPVRGSGGRLRGDQRGAVQGAGEATRATWERRPRWLWRGKRGAWDRDGLAESLSALAEGVAELAAAEARRLVLATAELAEHGEASVLEAIERAAQQSAATIGLAAVAGIMDWAGQHSPARMSCPDGEHAARLVARRTKTIRTLLGSVEITRGYYHCGACRAGFAPLDTRLGVQGTGLSPGLARACALAGSEMPYAKGFELITAVTGLDLASTSTLARTTRAQGARAREVIDAEQNAAMTSPRPIPAAVDEAGMGLCYIVMDGTGAPMLPRETTGRHGKTPGTRAGTREVKIGCFFTQSGCDPLTGDPVQDPGTASYISTFEPAAGFGAQAKAEYLRRGFDQIRQPVVLGDGAKWIWNIADQHFTTATQIVDYFHAREHLADLTKLLTPVLTDPTTFTRDLIDQLDLGNTAAIATAIDQLDLPAKAPDLARPAATETGYFTSNHHRMQYADFRAAGYYIGSGPVESACNTIVKQRSKRAGMHWTIAGLAPVLALRTLHQSNRDQELWPATQT